MDAWTQCLWPIHPKPKPGELLSSWIVRLARAHGMKVQTYCQLVFGYSQPVWNRDIDKLAPDAILNALCSVTGASREEARATTLASYEGLLYERHNPYGHTRWLLPLGIYHRTRRKFGLLYCPFCLRDDEEPYFRKEWRLAFNLVCERHGCRMLDRCTQCGAGVAFFRREMGDRHVVDGGEITRCHSCGFDLRFASAGDPPGPDGQTLLMLRSLILFHDLGWWFAGDETLAYSHLFFDVLHHLASLLTSVAGRKLREEIERQIGHRPFDTRPMEKSVLELRPLEERYWLILMALWLLQDWPERFIGACGSARLAQSRLLRGERFPWWFERVVKDRLDGARYQPNSAEAIHAAAYLTRHGRSISRNAVGKLLGSRAVGVAGRYERAKTSPWPRTDEDYARLLAALEARIKSSAAGSLTALLAERDHVIVLTMQVTGWRAAKVLALQFADVDSALNSLAPLHASVLRHLLVQYGEVVRPQLLAGEARERLFVGVRRDGIGVTNLAQRFRSLARRTDSH